MPDQCKQAASLHCIIGSGHLLRALLSSFASLQAYSTPLAPQPHPLQATLALHSKDSCAWGLSTLARGLFDSEPHSHAEMHSPASLPKQREVKHRCAVRQANRTHDAHGDGLFEHRGDHRESSPGIRPIRTLSWAWRCACRCEREGSVCNPTNTSGSTKARARVDACTAI